MCFMLGRKNMHAVVYSQEILCATNKIAVEQWYLEVCYNVTSILKDCDTGSVQNTWLQSHKSLKGQHEYVEKYVNPDICNRLFLLYDIVIKIN